MESTVVLVGPANRRLQGIIERVLREMGIPDVLLLPQGEGLIPQKVPERVPIILAGDLAAVNPSDSLRGVPLARRFRAQRETMVTGPLIVLTYQPLTHLHTQAESSDVLETKGVAVLRAPFLTSELKAVLEQTPALSEVEWKQVNHELRRNDLKREAAKLRHRSDSAFSTALTALYELEKLNYFNAPERERIRQNLEVVRTGLADARLNEFEKQVNTLAEEAGAVGCLDQTDREMIPTTFERLRGYGALVGQALTADAGNWNMRCREAASTRRALKGILDLLTRVGKSCGK